MLWTWLTDRFPAYIYEKGGEIVIDERVWYVLFPYLLNMSLTAAVVIAAVLLIRFALRRQPKIFSYALWAVVLFRLLCPVTVGSPLSLLGLGGSGVTTDGRMAYVPEEIVHMTHPEVDLPLPGVSEVINASFAPYWNSGAHDVYETYSTLALLIWMLGAAILLTVGAVQFIALCVRLVGAAHLQPRVYLADHIPTPFVLGLIRPAIFLPSSLDEAEYDYIIAHERHHIRRGDHIVRLLAFLALCLHWYNPLVWVAFVLSGRDMEMSCDEAVLRRLGDIRADYAASLLGQAAGRRITLSAPLAFGAGSVKARVANVMHYRAPRRWTVVVLSLLCLVAAVCLATNPTDNRHLLPTAEELRADVDPAIDEAVSAAILREFRSPDEGILCVESHLILDVRDMSSPWASPAPHYAVYALVLYEEYDAATGTQTSGSYIPAQINVVPTGNGYQPDSIVMPEDGNRYVRSIRFNFPSTAARAALDSQYYIDALQMENQAKREKMQNPS